MKNICVALAFLLLADHVSYVHMVNCTTSSDCTATDQVAANCVSGQCYCSKARTIQTEEGCAEKEAEPYVSTGIYSTAAIIGSEMVFFCEGKFEPHDPSATYLWYKDGTLIPGETDKMYNFTASVEAYYQCRIVSSVPGASSVLSEKLYTQIIRNNTSPSNPAFPAIIIKVSPAYAATGTTFSIICIRFPFGTVLEYNVNSQRAPNGQVTQLSSAVPVECVPTLHDSLSSLNITLDDMIASRTGPVVYASIVWTAMSSSVDIIGLTAFKTTETPNLTCSTVPPEENLPSSLTFTYRWDAQIGNLGVTTREWKIPATPARYIDLTCVVNSEPSQKKSIIIDDNYISVPKISQTPPRAYDGGRFLLTCNSDNQSLTYTWTADGSVIPGQFDSAIQYTNLLSSKHLTNYTCTVTKHGFSQTSQIMTPIIIDTFPTPNITGELTIDEDSTLNLTCNSAEGANLHLIYEWKLNGNPISNANETVYTVDSATASHAGNYTCSTSYFGVTSESAPVLVIVHRKLRSVSVTSSPNITSDVVYKTTDIMPILACETTPDPLLLPSVPNYTWEGLSVTTQTWTIPAVEAIHDAIRCSANGNSSEVFYTITIDDDYIDVPSISQTPASLHYTEDVTLTCSTGSSGVTYSWSKDGVVVLGESGSTFMLANINASDGISKFRCMTTKNLYSQESANYSLSVKNTLATPNVNGTLKVLKDETINLICNSDDEIDALTYEWWRNGTQIGGETNKNIAIQASASDNGEYKCTTNLLDLTATSATVTVEVKTTLATPTINGTTMTTVGGNLSMTCSSTDSLEISNIVYTLTRDGNDVQNGAPPVYSIVGVTSNETTNFTCRTHASTGALTSDESEPATVVIIGNLATPSVSGDNTVMEGDTLRLTCDSNDSPTVPMTYTWAKNGQQIPSATGQTYTLPNFQTGHGGNYTCKTEFLNLNSEMSLDLLVEYAAPGRPCTSGDDCPNEEESLTGICDLTRQRCICSDGYSAYMDYCNGVCNLVGSILTIVAVCLGSHMF